MYSLLNLIAASLVLNNGESGVTIMHQASAMVVARVVHEMVITQENRILALRGEASAINLYPPVSPVADPSRTQIAALPTVQQVSTNSITVLPAPSVAPIPTRAPVKKAVTPAPSTVAAPRMTATPRALAVSTPAPITAVSPVAAVQQPLPAASVQAVPPVVAPPVIQSAPPVVTPPRPTQPAVQNVAVAQPATTNQASSGVPQINGPVLAAVNSENVGTYHLTIPKLGLTNIPVNPTDARNDTKWKNDLKVGVGQLLCPPGSNCKTVIFGHSSNYASVISNYNYVFKDLVKLVAGDEVQIQYQGQTLRYRVVKSEVVGANTASIVTNYGREELVLFTCWPLMTSKNRAVVYLDRIYQ